MKKTYFIFFVSYSLSAATFTPPIYLTPQPETSAYASPKLAFGLNNSPICAYSDEFGGYIRSYVDYCGYSPVVGAGSLPPSMGSDQTGKALVVWRGGSSFNSAFLEPGSFTWEAIDTVYSSDLTNLGFYMSVNGDAATIFNTNNYLGPLYVCQLQNGNSSWASPIELFPQHTYNPKILLDSSGDGIALWRTTPDNPSRLYVSIYNKQSNSWSTPQFISQSLYVWEYDAVCDAAGNIYIPFIGLDSGISTLYMMTYMKNDHVITPPQELLSASNLDFLKIACNDPGDLFISYREIDSKYFGLIKYKNQSSFSEPKLIIAEENNPMTLNMDNYGNASYISRRISDYQGIASFLPYLEKNFSLPIFFYDQPSINDWPYGLIDSQGNLYAMWNNKFSAGAYSSVFMSHIIAPPSRLVVQKQVNNFGFFKEYYNQLTWQISPSSEANGYHLYRNDELIATLGSKINSYQDRDRPKNSQDVYTIEAFSLSSISPLVTGKE